MILALVLLVLLVVSLLSNLGWLLSDFTKLKPMHGATAGPRLEEVVLQDNDASDKIAVIEIEGIITEFMGQGGVNLVDLVKAQLKRAKEDDKVKAVVLKVNSPGGEVLASDEIYQLLTEFQQGRGGKPVVCSMGSLAASGGYYVSAPCRGGIVANELTITGSIGVIMSSWNYRGLMDKVGVRPMVFKSGRFKDMLSSSKEPSEITQEEKDMIQSLIDETFGKFKSIVAEGREKAYRAYDKENRKLNADWEKYADGRVLSGTEAYRLGFVDELGNFEKAVTRAKRIAAIGPANLVEYQQRLDFTDLFRIFGQSDAKAVKIDLGMDLPKLQAGQLYFLAPNYFH